MRRGAIGKTVLDLDSVPGCLTRDDDRWGCRSSVEIVSAAADDDFLGVGSSPVLGDVGNTALPIPATRTATPSRRYLFRLASFEIPSGRAAVIRGVRQLLTIRDVVPLEAGGSFVYEREVVSPLWHFVDGNVSWHIRWATNTQARCNVYDAGQIAGTSPSTWGTDSALVYNPPLVPYIPPGGGIPPGKSVEFLGTWRDMRYPWDKTSWDLNVPVIGPGVVTFWASVLQTDATERPEAPPVANVAGLRPEDQFLLQFPNCVYGHVGGAMLVDLYPCCEEVK